MFFLFFAFFCLGIPFAQQGKQLAQPLPDSTARETQALAAPELVAPTSAAPGDPLLVWMKSDSPAVSASISLQNEAGKQLSAAEAFFVPRKESGYLYGFLLPVPIKTQPGRAFLALSVFFDRAPETAKKTEARLDLQIETKKFMREDIPLNSSNTAILTAPDPAKTAETKAFAKIFATRDITAFFAEGTMVKPLSASWRETAGFADERRYIYSSGGSDSSFHGGLDLGAKEGSEVLACARGRVVFAKNRIVTGNTVVLEHLPGLFSIYMHLSEIIAAEGDIVDAGEIIGRVGSTGLSTGPHLHWELRIGAVSVNPSYWLSRPLR